MKNVDCDIYINQLLKFFETNPNELKVLIGNLDKNIFFKKIKDKVYQNLSSGEDYILTKNQMLDIIVNIFKEKKDLKEVEQGFWRTKFGDICIN
jgi:hypothetical protein